MSNAPTMKTFALGIGIVLAACNVGGGGTDDDEAPDAGTSTARRIEPAPCKFAVSPSLGLVEGQQYSCGNLVVPENRATPTREIKLHFIQFKKSATTAERATIYLDGGPGGSGEGIVYYINALGPAFLTGLQSDGDFLVIGQRGTALSQPFLNCQTANCGEYASIAHLPSYNTAYNADDVDDLRAALGYDKLNLYGISYGSRLGLEVLRRHGDRVRAAVVEGLVPSQVVWPAAVPASFYSALTALDASCTGGCKTAYGNLVTKFQTGVDALRANPATVTVSQGSFTIDGDQYADILFAFLYSKSTYPYLPLMISDLAVRRTDRIAPFFSMVLAGEGEDNLSTGLYLSVVCGEIFNPPDQGAFDRANAGVPVKIRDQFSSGWFGMIQTCAAYPKHAMQAELNQPVASAVRTFVSSGSLDPITPPSFGDIAKQSLSNSFHVVHANSGHGATLQSTCGQNNLFKFLANPTATLDATCASAITTSYVMPNAFTATEIPFEQIRAELDLVPRPRFVTGR